MQEVLIELEEKDKKEREVGLDRIQRLRQIPRETGEFLFQFLITYSQIPDFLGLEIGTSGGYSTIWQGMALLKNGQGKLISLDHDLKKYKFASQNITSTGVSQFVELIHKDAKHYLKETQHQFDYVFMDCEKEDYLYFFEFLINRLTRGSVLIADNVISHADNIQEFIDLINSDSRVSTIILPIGKGLALIQWL